MVAESNLNELEADLHELKEETILTPFDRNRLRYCRHRSTVFVKISHEVTQHGRRLRSCQTED